MNRKGILPIVIIAIFIVAVFGAIAFVLFPWITSALAGQCNEMESNFGLDSGNSVWQEICIDPDNQEIRNALIAQGADPNAVPSDSWSIAKITCRKNTGFCLFPPCWDSTAVEIVEACETSQNCVESGQNASCESPATCNNNGTCETVENNTSCPADCPTPMICNNNGVCETGENRHNCLNDCKPPEF